MNNMKKLEKENDINKLDEFYDKEIKSIQSLHYKNQENRDLQMFQTSGLSMTILAAFADKNYLVLSSMISFSLCILMGFIDSHIVNKHNEECIKNIGEYKEKQKYVSNYTITGWNKLISAIKIISYICFVSGMVLLIMSFAIK